jgi:hypothetical protein
MNSSQALAKTIGASALIMRTSSSDFMTFLIRASCVAAGLGLD